MAPAWGCNNTQSSDHGPPLSWDGDWSPRGKWGAEGEKVVYLSADDSNSQSSPVLVRSLIQSGHKVPAKIIRIWEFFNYYNFSYEPPGDRALSVSQQLRPYDMEEGLYALQIGVQGRLMDEMKRRPMNITLILDNSGSMGGQPIELLKESCRAIASSLLPGDRISMVTWDTQQTVLLDSLAVDGADDETLLNTIDSLDAGGGTNLHAGLGKGYELAEKNLIENGLNRAVLISDGMANVGITEEEIIAEAAKGAEGKAIYLVGVGVGDGGYNDELMDTVTDWGKGASLFIDSKEEARKMFGDRFLANMELAALNVQLEMTLPPYFDVDEFFGEEISEEASEVEPQHLSPNDAMIYQQLIKTTEPSLVYGNQTIDLKVTFTDAKTGQADEVSLSSTLQELVDAPYYELRKGDTIVVYAQTLGKMAKLISDGDLKQALVACAWGLEIVQESASALDDADLDEIAGLLETYCEARAEDWEDGPAPADR